MFGRSGEVVPFCIVDHQVPGIRSIGRFESNAGLQMDAGAKLRVFIT